MYTGHLMDVGFELQTQNIMSFFHLKITVLKSLFRIH